MKKYSLLILFVAAVTVLHAQRSGRRTGNRNTNQPNTTNPTTTEPTNVQQQNNINLPVNNRPDSIPVIYDTATTVTAPKKSLRVDGAFDKSGLNKRIPLTYEDLRWDDALYAEKVWREIDFREKINRVFQYEAQDDNGSQIFVDILMKAVTSGAVTAFADDRFTTPMSLAEVQQLTVGSTDTVNKVDVNDPNKIVARVVTKKDFDSKSVLKLRLKEEWVFDREASRMFVRILGICPMVILYNEKTGKERGVSNMFWIYYPELRPVLATYEVYNPKNMGQSRMTWEELFESRMFSSYILKSTLDNPGNKYIRAYVKDPILALLEGDNVKEKIFNYEQDLWSY